MTQKHDGHLAVLNIEKGISVNNVNIVDEELTDSLYCVGEFKDVEANYVRQENTRSPKGLKVGTSKREGSTIEH